MRPCPVRLRARAVLAAKTGTSLDATLHRIPVIGVDMAVEADEVVRAEVFDPKASPRATVTIGRRTARLTIRQEVYGDIRPHLALLRACPVRVVRLDAEDGAVESDPSARGEMCTVRVIEVGGNVYDIERALGVCEVEGSPGERMTFTFTLVGELVQPTDYAGGGMAIVPIPQPLIYRNASIVAPRLDLGSCPEFTFSGGGEVGTIDMTCDPEGGKMAYVQRSAAATLELAGVLARKESVDRVWETAREPLCDETVTATLYQDGAAELRLSIQGTAIVLPELSEIEGFAGYDVRIGGGRWALEWEGFAEETWTPLELSPLVWLDPSDVSTLFVDAAGTTPVVASGDPVGLWVNKGTLGSVGDAAQAVSASRPVWADAGGGMIVFDGLGSLMRTTYTPTLPQSVFMLARRTGPPPTGGANRIISTPVSLPYIQLNDTSTGITAAWSDGSVRNAQNNNGRSTPIIGAEWSAGRFRSYIGDTVAANDALAPTDFTAAGPWAINTNGSVAYECGDIFIFDRILTDQERAQLIAWMEAQHGI